MNLRNLFKKQKTKFIAIPAIAIVLFFVFTPVANAQVENIPVWNAISGIWETFGPGGEDPITRAIKGLVGDGLSAITSLTLFISGLFLQLAGLLLNQAIQISVVDMSRFISTESVSAGGVRDAWTVIRDIANIGFIFAIAYIAIATILRLSGRGIKDLLVKLIISALLINFSFFFTGLLIDASNILTLGIYNRISSTHSIVTRQPGSPTPVLIDDVTNNFEDISVFGISGVFINQMKLPTIYNGLVVAEDASNGFTPGAAFGISIFGSAFILILALVFAIIGLFFLLRLTILIILIITSPIAYLGLGFPGLRNASKQWWDTFLGQLIWPVAYMVMTLAVIEVITGDGFRNAIGLNGPVGSSDFSAAILSGFSVETFAIIINYLIVTGLVLASIIGAKKFASQGSGAVSNATGKFAAAVPAGLGFAGRQTLGRAGSAVVGSGRLEKYARSGRVGSGFARTLRTTGNFAQKSSFDLRATNAGKSLSDTVGAGKKASGKDGYKKILEDRAKRIDDRAKLIGKRSKTEVQSTEEYTEKVGEGEKSIQTIDERINSQENLLNRNISNISANETRLKRVRSRAEEEGEILNLSEKEVEEKVRGTDEYKESRRLQEEKDEIEKIISEENKKKKERQKENERELKLLSRDLETRPQRDYAKKQGEGGRLRRQVGRVVKPAVAAAIVGALGLGLPAVGVAAGATYLAGVGTKAKRKVAREKIEKRLKEGDGKEAKAKKIIEDIEKEAREKVKSEKENDSEEENQAT